MAQLGMRVPATSARLTPVDSILTRMGAYDNMFSNASTFKVELDECCKILRDATPRSLVILDGASLQVWIELDEANFFRRAWSRYFDVRWYGYCGGEYTKDLRRVFR